VSWPTRTAPKSAKFLKDRESRCRENVPHYVYFKDTESRFILTSRAHARALGLRDPAEAIGKSDKDFFSEEHARKAFNDEQRIIRTGEALVDAEERETWPDRPDTWALTTKVPLRDQRGTIVGTLGILRNITDRKKAEERIQSLARFPDENPHPVMRVTSEGLVIYSNKASEVLTTCGRSRQAVECRVTPSHGRSHWFKSSIAHTNPYAVGTSPISRCNSRLAR
jgi:PAS domain S-box-containing protein